MNAAQGTPQRPPVPPVRVPEPEEAVDWSLSKWRSRPGCDYCDEPAAIMRETWTDSSEDVDVEFLCRVHRSDADIGSQVGLPDLSGGR